MEILIAGHSGVIGSSLYKYLTNPNSFKNLNETINIIGLDSKNLDLTNESKIEQFISTYEKFDILIYLVALAHSKGNKNDFFIHEEINYKTLINTIRVLKRYDKIPQKIIYTSTISVYGERIDQEYYNEDLLPRPFSPYAKSKYKAENFLFKYYKNKTWILRLAPVYSKDFLLNINRRTKIGLLNYKVGYGNKKLSLCNIKNIHKVVSNVITGNIPPDIYNVSDKIYYTYNILIGGNKPVLRIPRFTIWILYFLGKGFKNIFIIENSVKLLTNNIFPSNKLSKFVKLNAKLT